jgi:hypothetical protein
MDAQLYGKVQTLPTIIRLGWKSLHGTNTQAYYEITDKKYYNICPRFQLKCFLFFCHKFHSNPYPI